MPAQFVHLHLHTDYSLVDGLVRIGPLIDAVFEAGMPAVAVTDQHNLFATVKVHTLAKQAGVKPILAADLCLRDSHDPKKSSRFVLLCQTIAGYHNLSRLLSRAYTEGQYLGLPMLRLDWLDGQTDGLICLAGGREGLLGKALLNGLAKEAEAIVHHWQALFPNRFYLELIRTGREDEERYIHAALDLAEKHDLPVVATNDVRFIHSDEFEAHEAKVCISNGELLDDPHRVRVYSDEQYLRTPAEMIALFSDIPEAIKNTVEIAKRCNVELTLGEYHLPDFPVPPSMTIGELLSQESYQGLHDRLTVLLPELDDRERHKSDYEARLQAELDVINQMGFAGYFLIVADFISWAKKNGIPVGPGRGSGAGSLVAYALNITDVDPLQYGLLFERFLNPERVSMPDFDIDFCMEGRDRVIDYVAERYGRDHVSQIITYGTMAAKAVLRDVGRVLGYPYGFVDGLAKLVPFELKMTLTKAMKEEPSLQERYDNNDEDYDVKTLIDLALKLEGLTRNAGKHAGGVVIAPKPLTEFTPLYCEEGGVSLVSQYDKDDVENIGLVKFDFLGLKTLTVIDWAVKNVKAMLPPEEAEKIDMVNLPLDDKATYDLLKRADTVAVFQLESHGMKDLIKRLSPDTFEDIVALVALFRPGPLQSGMVDDFVDRKHGRSAISYLHPDLESVLKTTYGVIVYQEQVMQIAQILAGYSLGGADMLRRAMGKKKPEEMKQQRHLFLQGAKGRNIDKRVASSIFNLMEKFAEYGFNKSHSVAYALVAYQTAWLKTHYKAAFMAAVLSADMDNTDKIVRLIDDCRNMGLKVTAPDVNHSQIQFTAIDKATIRYGMGAIKGVGESVSANIVKQRECGEPFTGLYDFCQRVDTTKVNRGVLYALVKSGALDSLGTHRASLLASLNKALHIAEQHRENCDSGQNDMFGLLQVDDKSRIEEPLIESTHWSEDERLGGEKETLGLYLSGHPINRYNDELSQFISRKISELDIPEKYYQHDQSPAILAGLVEAVRTKKNKGGAKMAFITLDDQSARLDVRIFSEVYDKCQAVIQRNQLVIVEGKIDQDNFTGGLAVTASNVYNITYARELFAQALVITIDNLQGESGWVKLLQDTLTPFQGGKMPVEVSYANQSARAHICLDQHWYVKPTDVLLANLAMLPIVMNAKIKYK